MADSTAHSSRMVYPPFIHVVWGIVLLLAFLLGTMIQVQTTEAFMLHSENPASWVPNMNLFMEFPEYWSGHMDFHQTVAFIAAWCIQIILITCKIGMVRVQIHMMKKFGANATHEEIQKIAKRRGLGWDIGSWIFMGTNCVIDVIYAWSQGPIQALLFAGAVFLTTYYSGTHGLQHITAGVTDMAK